MRSLVFLLLASCAAVPQENVDYLEEVVNRSRQEHDRVVAVVPSPLLHIPNEPVYRGSGEYYLFSDWIYRQEVGYFHNMYGEFEKRDEIFVLTIKREDEIREMYVLDDSLRLLSYKEIIVDRIVEGNVPDNLGELNREDRDRALYYGFRCERHLRRIEDLRRR
jgi:hypothetical protein